MKTLSLYDRHPDACLFPPPSLPYPIGVAFGWDSSGIREARKEGSRSLILRLDNKATFLLAKELPCDKDGQESPGGVLHLILDLYYSLP